MDFMQLLINAHELEDDDVSTGERSLSPGPGSKKTKLAMDDVVSQVHYLICTTWNLYIPFGV